MTDQTENIVIKRQPKGIDAQSKNITLPAYLLAIVDEEASTRKFTRSAVVAYLILCGLKAHIGEFYPPKENTIKEAYIRRGRTW